MCLDASLSVASVCVCVCVCVRERERERERESVCVLCVGLCETGSAKPSQAVHGNTPVRGLTDAKEAIDNVVRWR